MGVHLASEVSKRHATITNTASFPASFEHEDDEESQHTINSGRNKLLDDEWKMAIEKHPHIGLFTLSYMHDSSNLFRKIGTKFLLLVIPALQVMIAVAINWLPTTHGAVIVSPLNCPSTSSSRFERVVAGAVGFIYFVKSVIFLFKNVNKNLQSDILSVGCCGGGCTICNVKDIFSFVDRLFTPNRHIEGNKIEPFIEQGKDGGGFIQVFYNLDRGVELGFVPLIYSMNVYIVFNTREPIEMVVNSLAIDFISRIHYNVKAEYLKYFRIDGRAWAAAAARSSESSSSERTTTWQRWVLVHPVTVISLYYLVGCLLQNLLIAPVYLPLCKPEGVLGGG